MKPNIHPPYHPVCFVDVSSGKRFLTCSSMTSKDKETINGLEYYMVIRDVTSDSHPVYTGEKRFVDSAGRVEKFQRKFGRRLTRSS
jgi:large subunit ribosomal protein L31